MEGVNYRACNTGVWRARSSAFGYMYTYFTAYGLMTGNCIFCLLFILSYVIPSQVSILPLNQDQG
jgi:hypothetical protein